MAIKLSMPTSDQVSAGLRHLGTATATTVGVFTVLGVLSPDQAAAVIADVHQIADGLQNAFGGFSKLILIVGPVAAGIFAKGAMTAASLKKQLTSITSNTKVEIDGKIVVPADVANAVPSNQVVSK